MLTGFNNNRFNMHLARALVVILTCLWFGGIVQHYCLDGMEPDITLHLENLNGHVDHEDGSGRNDFERTALTDNLLPKNYDFGIQLFSLLLIIIAQLRPAASQRFLLLHTWAPSWSHVLRPPLRAPPAHS